MAFYLRGKDKRWHVIFPPKEATQMSHDVKYIGMDVHKEATVIAVLNESGKQVIESVIETKASSILEFLHGLRGRAACDLGNKCPPKNRWTLILNGSVLRLRGSALQIQH